MPGLHGSAADDANPVAGLPVSTPGAQLRPATELSAAELSAAEASLAADLSPVAGDIDHPRIERAVREILLAIGEDPDRDGLRDTPARVARSYAEQFAGLRQRPHDVRDIEVYSTCEHHLVPFFGFAHIGYIPNEKGQLTGLSKLARLVDVYARRPQVQERMTSQIADALVSTLEPRGVIVVIEAEHLCMTMRGVRKPGAKTLTSAVRGIFRDSDRTRAEAMSLLYGRR
jgi:GTP cyclohydrolase I